MYVGIGDGDDHVDGGEEEEEDVSKANIIVSEAKNLKWLPGGPKMADGL